MAIIQIVDVSLIKLPQDIAFLPPGPTIPLSFFDLWWVTAPPVRSLFLYPDFSPSSSEIESLKSSLSTALRFFHLLAGELTFDPNSSSFSICCTSETGVTFIKAESDIDVAALAHNSTFDMESYNQLLPKRTREELPLPILAVQVTEFVNGGIAIGTTSHHVAMDGIGLMRFIETWCAVHQGKDAQVMPVHDRSMISFQGHEEVSKRFVEFLVSKLSNISRRRTDDTLESRLEIVRKRFVLREVSIQSLKRQVVEKSSTSIPIPSTFQVVTAYLWTCIAKTKGLSDNDELTYLCFVTDCRNTLNLPVTSAYIGNCIYGTRAELTGSILASTDGLVQATVATARAIKKAKSEPLKGIEKLKEYKSLPEGLKVFVSGTLRFYDADFGWGKPERMEFMPTNNRDVQVFILAGKEKGTIQVSLGLPKDEMDVFSNIFVTDLDAATTCASL